MAKEDNNNILGNLKKIWIHLPVSTDVSWKKKMFHINVYKWMRMACSLKTVKAPCYSNPFTVYDNERRVLQGLEILPPSGSD